MSRVVAFVSVSLPRLPKHHDVSMHSTWLTTGSSHIAPPDQPNDLCIFGRLVYRFSGSGWGSGASLLSKSMSESVWKMVDSAENLR